MKRRHLAAGLLNARALNIDVCGLQGISDSRERSWQMSDNDRYLSYFLYDDAA